jgi:ribonuclease P protein component
MLPSQHRLRLSQEIRDVARYGARISDKYFVVHLLVSSPGDTSVSKPKATVVVPSAVGKAVDRNRVRRRVRHLLTPMIQLLPDGSSVIIRILSGAPPVANTELQGRLRRALARAVTKVGLP